MLPFYYSNKFTNKTDLSLTPMLRTHIGNQRRILMICPSRGNINGDDAIFHNISKLCQSY